MIQIAKPFLGKEEIKAVEEVILSGWVTQGPKVREFEQLFSSIVESKYACAVSSCTTALHIALSTVGVSRDDAVITVSHSFIATANAIRHCGAEPIFVDIDPMDYNMSPDSLENLLKECTFENGQLYSKASRRIGAILAVHQMGMPCHMEKILALAKKFNLPVVEDAACAIGSEIFLAGNWDKIGKPHGDIACFSFHPRKVITTGDGGMLSTNNEEYDKQFRLLRHHGMNISDEIRHKADKVLTEEYVVTGYNYRLTDLQAAIGIEQLKKLPQIIASRREIGKLYQKFFGDIKWLELPKSYDYALTNWQSYPIKVLSQDAPMSRDQLMLYLLEQGIATRTGIMNAHQQKPYFVADLVLPESEKAREQVILFPVYCGLKEKDIEKMRASLLAAKK